MHNFSNPPSRGQVVTSLTKKIALAGMFGIRF